MIHTDNPFLPHPDDRDPARRFRGRLAAPVTIVTAGGKAKRAGLTVSSLFVVEGDPSSVHLLLGPSTDLWEAITNTSRFVIHICSHEDQLLADVFAGLSPSPGGVFAATETSESDYGPVIKSLANRAFCSLGSQQEAGYSGLIEAQIDQVEVSDVADPLVHFRGRYRGLS